ncbi:MAG TPA: hypothetical protein VEX38_06820 [Fimbriimonadaceae bacterium]|nr:hypothetical protein [Fimbriimonadaceae bacterium]
MIALICGMAMAQTPLDAAGVLERTRQAYSNCKTYRDTAEIALVELRHGKPWTIKRRIKTFFSAPDQIRIEHDQERKSGAPDLMVLWTENGSYRTWWSLMPGVHIHRDREPAFRWAREVMGRGMHIADLLLGGPQADWTAASLAGEPELLPDAKVGGRTCYTVVLPKARRTKIWIDKATFLIRKTHTPLPPQNRHVEVTSSYSPEVGVALPASAFGFKPGQPSAGR